MPGQIIADFVPGRFRSDKLVITWREFWITLDRALSGVKDVGFRLVARQNL